MKAVLSSDEASVFAKNILMALEKGVEVHIKLGDDIQYITTVFSAIAPYRPTLFLGDKPLTEEERNGVEYA